MESVDLNISIELIREYFSNKKLHIINIVLFGSRARGEAPEDSDYDILILIEEELTPRERRTILSEMSLYLFSKRRMLPMDVILKSSRIYEEEKENIGSLAYNVSRENVVLV